MNIVGRVRNNHYQDSDGVEVYGLAFTVDEIDYLDSKAESEARRTPMARSNSPTLGHPKFPQAGPPDYDDSGATAMRAAASLRR